MKYLLKVNGRVMRLYSEVIEADDDHKIFEIVAEKFRHMSYPIIHRRNFESFGYESITRLDPKNYAQIFPLPDKAIVLFHDMTGETETGDLIEHGLCQKCYLRQSYLEYNICRDCFDKANAELVNIGGEI